MLGGDKFGKPIATVKSSRHSTISQEQYKDIVPGYYMNKEHWNSLYLEGDVPDEFSGYALESYSLVLPLFRKSNGRIKVRGQGSMRSAIKQISLLHQEFFSTRRIIHLILATYCSRFDAVESSI